MCDDDTGRNGHSYPVIVAVTIWPGSDQPVELAGESQRSDAVNVLTLAGTHFTWATRLP